MSDGRPESCGCELPAVTAKDFAAFDGFQNPFAPPPSVPQVSWLRRLLGDEGVKTIILFEDNDRDELQAAFPEAEVEVWHVRPST